MKLVFIRLNYIIVIPGLSSLLIFYDLKRRLIRTTYKMLAKKPAKILQDSYKISKLRSPGIVCGSLAIKLMQVFRQVS